ncbi:5-formyltetrahydrofolate cyclo-ligase [Phenylobacterium soli]|uniref:5-formyltetrahydrofolate cyclo-ligase n=2 Tax=Phenylobacterium soli TaxID=2170551 RepID=A0A328ARR8_9CAUL|nr:5-formyltetrahydrofolate cyclo-ligase [Phenylobacterium soli]
MRRLRRSLAAAAPDAGFRAAEALPLEALPDGPVAVYYAQGSELDPTPLAERLAAAGRTVALPAAQARDGRLQFRRWRIGEALEADAVGVPAPGAAAEAVTPRVVVTPLVAYDARGGRLGQGGGHYDRTLENLRAAGPVFVLGLAYAGQAVDEIPMEPHDQRLDAILTEAGYQPVEKD